MYEIIQRNPFSITFQIIDVDSRTLKETPVNLEGRILTYVIKRQDDDSDDDNDALINESFLLDDSAQNGTVTINLTSEQTDLEFQTYDFEVRTSEGTGENKTIYTHIQDQIKIIKSIIKQV